MKSMRAKHIQAGRPAGKGQVGIPKGGADSDVRENGAKIASLTVVGGLDVVNHADGGRVVSFYCEETEVW